MRIRRLTTDDAEAVSKLHQLMDAPWEHPWSVQSYHDLLTQPSTYGWGVWDMGDTGDTEDAKDTLRSFILTQYCAPEAEILYLATHPTYQGQGYAKALFQHMIEALKSQDALTHVTLDVCVENKKALSFYKILQFKIICIRKKYYKTNKDLFLDAFILILSL